MKPATIALCLILFIATVVIIAITGKRSPGTLNPVPVDTLTTISGEGRYYDGTGLSDTVIQVSTGRHEALQADYQMYYIQHLRSVRTTKNRDSINYYLGALDATVKAMDRLIMTEIYDTK